MLDQVTGRQTDMTRYPVQFDARSSSYRLPITYRHRLDDKDTRTSIALFGGRIETSKGLGPKRYFVELRERDNSTILYDGPSQMKAFLEAIICSSDFDAPLMNEL